MKRDADTSKLESLPDSDNERKEAFLAFLGQELMAFRHNALKRSLSRASAESLESMPTVERTYKQSINNLSPEAHETCRQACEKTLSEFMFQFLTLVTSHASNWPLGDRHGFNYRLLVEVIDLPKAKSQVEPPRDDFGDDEDDDFDPPDKYPQDDRPTYGQVLETIDLSSGAQLHLPNYWYRWLNRYGREPSPKQDPK